MNKTTTLNEEYWNQRYAQAQTGWDIGDVSAPLKLYIDQLKNKELSILIPGCGNAYEAAYLLAQGFTNISLVDISPLLIEKLRQRFGEEVGKRLHLICDDFFNLQTTYDLILEQTFFCALDPFWRENYVQKMHALLKERGKLVGLLFNRDFTGGPPFGGSEKEYRSLMEKYFTLTIMEPSYNSIEPRHGTELFFIAVKRP